MAVISEFICDTVVYTTDKGTIIIAMNAFLQETTEM